MPDGDHAKIERWVGIWRYIISFLIGVIVASYVVGGARQRVTTLGKDMDNWKEEWRTVHKPRIERMDSTGTISFDLFHKEYEKTQHRQEETIKDLDKRVRDLERNGKQ